VPIFRQGGVVISGSLGRLHLVRIAHSKIKLRPWVVDKMVGVRNIEEIRCL